jgi:trehalose monomycolate/heme transporter
VRAAEPPPGATVIVGGESAALVDLLAGLGERLPWVALFAVAVTLVLLFLAFGSVVLPVKAVLMNALSLAAMLGVVVWVFQEGHGAGVFGFTPIGVTEATQPILMVAIAFGLSMDYEVFLLSRMREQWDLTGDNALAVERGLARTGRIITSAAVLFVVVVGAFAFSGLSLIALVGVGLGTAVLIDATVVRALLVPATMSLLGRWNWWAPAPMARWWESHGLHEAADDVVASVR